ncbi:LysR family transcriptional regulator [Undibacterium sp.]|uniref:LysR family transcriptional regulator n=1 Tax=Undibacterium sp. TaxID=1914977 RepID=UPI002C6FE5F9|nr:LysR family transcriptional regulator [Undibacterium sp.]HTD03282.1 LysR family transcriptional regulator [Undibacterium sp.]
MDRLQSMRVFLKVVEQGSFARAALALDLSNAAVTRYLAELENHLGTRLLNRSTRKLSLTEIGQAYLERVQRILPEIDDADAIAKSQSKEPSGLLRLYAHQSFAQFQLASLLSQYSERFPAVGLDVTVSSRGVDLVQDRFDVGIMIGIQKIEGNMIARQLGKAEVFLCASPEYIRRHGEPKTPKDLEKHACLNFDYKKLRNAWSIQGPDGEIDIPVNNKIVCNNGDLLSGCAIAGMGLVLRASFALADALKSGKLVRLLPKTQFNQLAVTLVYPNRHLLPATARSFVDFMTEQYPHPEIDPWEIT